MTAPRPTRAAFPPDATSGESLSISYEILAVETVYVSGCFRSFRSADFWRTLLNPLFSSSERLARGSQPLMAGLMGQSI